MSKNKLLLLTTGVFILSPGHIALSSSHSILSPASMLLRLDPEAIPALEGFPLSSSTSEPGTLALFGADLLALAGGRLATL